MLVLPVLAPVTTPSVPTSATDGMLLLHVPPRIAGVKVVMLPPAPAQIDAWPVIGAGDAFTVTIAVVAVTVHAPFTAVKVYTPALPETTPLTAADKEVPLVTAVPPGLAHE